MWESVESFEYNAAICEYSNDEIDIGYRESEHCMLSWCRRWDGGNQKITAVDVENYSAIGFSLHDKTKHIAIKIFSIVYAGSPDN